MNISAMHGRIIIQPSGLSSVKGMPIGPMVKLEGLPGALNNGLSALTYWADMWVGVDQIRVSATDGQSPPVVKQIPIEVWTCPNDCSMNGMCLSNGTCDCTGGWAGNDCSVPPCNKQCNRGNCVNNTCMCEMGWGKDQNGSCTVQDCPGGCGQGICTQAKTCQCNPGWKGIDCKTRKCPGANGECNLRGACVNNGTCDCQGGFTGMACEVAPAPNVTTIRFDNSGSKLIVMFSIDTNRAGVFTVGSCAALIDQQSMPRLGGAATCGWNDDKTLVINLAGNPTILPGDWVAIKSGAVRAKGCQNTCPTTVANKTAMFPSTPLVPQVVINAPSQVAFCDDFTMNVMGSTGSGGRPMTFEWTVGGMTPNKPVLNMVFGQLTAQSGMVTLNPVQMNVSSQNYKFCVRARNFLNESSQACHTVFKSDLPLPSSEIAGNSVLNGVFRVLGLTLQGVGRPPSCGGQATQAPLKFAWRRLGGPMPQGVITDRRDLVIPKGVLMANATYDFELMVAIDGSPHLNSTASVKVVVQFSNLIARIANGNRAVGSGTALILNATTSLDLDEQMAPFAFSWTCQGAGQSACISQLNNQAISLPSSGVVSVAANTLAQGTYYFQVTVSKPGRAQQSATVTITMVAGAPPQVSIAAQSNEKHRIQDILLLQGTAVSSSNAAISYLWSVDINSLNLDDSAVVLSSKTSPNLVIKAGALQPQEYVFRLTATDVNGAAYAVSKIVVNAPPSSGSVSVSPASGIELNTTFTLSANGWSDAPEDGPFTYSFGYQVGSTKFTLASRVSSSEFKTLLPKGMLTLFCIVFDNKGSGSTAATTNVTVNALQGNAGAVIGKLETEVNKQVDDAVNNGDIQSLVSISISFASSINNLQGQNQNDQNKLQLIRNKVLNAVKDSIANSSINTPETLNQLSQATALTSKDDKLEPSAQRVVVANVKQLIAQATGNNVNVNEETANELVGSLNNVFKASPLFNSSRASQTTSELRTLVKDLVKNLKDLANTMQKDLLCDANQRDVNTETIKMNVQKNSPSRLGSGHKLKSPSGAQFSVPANAFQGGDCRPSTVYSVSKNMRGYATANDQLGSDIVSLSFDQSVSNLGNPIRIVMPTTSAPGQGETASCRFFNETTETFSSAGCTLVSTNASFTECDCNHLTEFAALVVAQSNTPTPTPTPTSDASSSPTPTPSATPTNPDLEVWAQVMIAIGAFIVAGILAAYGLHKRGVITIDFSKLRTPARSATVTPSNTTEMSSLDSKPTKVGEV
eukprot:TRINITY_DN302_c0_g2_i1.p1 TRINITY_DN302_c0_g2~~TRINITY_DN302_c0_g2_i1.p1  ORF type:complete len:1333 (-),score=434.12 TRINITY_DN302_c0_g2_i1:50-3820(-)